MPATDKLILGTVQFGLDYGINNRSGKPGPERVASILDLAFANNIGLLDTAEAYGDAQEVIGNYHRTSANRFEVITKFSAGRSDLSSDLTERVAQDLQALRLDSLYGYMFHSYKDFEKYYDRYSSELDALKTQGLIRKFGVSVYTNSELEQLLSYPVDLVQLPFNMLDNQSQRGALINAAKAKGMEVHTRSVFLQGLFFMEELPEKLKALKPYLDDIRQLAKQYNIGLSDIALNYAVHQKQIDHVLIGVDTVEQLQENMASLGKNISGELAERLDQLHVEESSLLNPSTWNS